MNEWMNELLWKLSTLWGILMETYSSEWTNKIGFITLLLFGDESTATFQRSGYIKYTSHDGGMMSTLFSKECTSSSSIGTATLLGFGLLNYRWVFSAGRFLQSAVASGMSNPQIGGPVIRTFQLPPPGVPHVWNDASEPQERKVELWTRNGREFCREWRLPRHFWILLHALNLRHGTDGFTSPPKKGALRIFFSKRVHYWHKV